MKKLIILTSILLAFACEPQEESPLFAKDLIYDNFKNLSGQWFQDDYKTKFKYLFRVSLPDENNDVKFILKVQEYDSYKLTFYYEGKFNLKDTRKREHMGNPVNYLKLRYERDGKEVIDDTSIMILTKFNGKYIEAGRQLKYLVISDIKQLGRGFKKTEKNDSWNQERIKSYDFENFSNETTMNAIEKLTGELVNF